MTPRRPYMLRAFYNWLVDNDLTPHLVVDAQSAGVRVPLEFVQDGQIILNIAPRAVGNLDLGNDVITFSARFSGRPHSIIVPLYAVQAIYARENGAGTMFEPEEAYEYQTPEEPSELQPLSIATPPEAQAAEDESGSDKATNKATKAKGRPTLTVVK